MPGGRPRTPNRLKALQGETRPSRLRPEPQPLEAEPSPPEWLTVEGRAAWDRITDELRGMSLLFRADQDLIACYASTVALFGEAERRLKTEGHTYVDDRGVQRRSPWLVVRSGALDQLRRLASELGLSPQSRTHLEIEPPPDPLIESLLSKPGRDRR